MVMGTGHNGIRILAETVSSNTPATSSKAWTAARRPNSVAVNGDRGSITTTFTNILLASSLNLGFRRRHGSAAHGLRSTSIFAAGGGRSLRAANGHRNRHGHRHLHQTSACI